MVKQSTIFNQEPVRRTVVSLDLARFMEIVRSLQDGHKVGANAAKLVKSQIQGLVRRAIEQSGADFKESFVESTGDGAILQFESIMAADKVAVALHQLSYAECCQSARHALEWRSFRIGIYTGEVVLGPGSEISGTVVGEATRLQARARTGQIVIDADSCAKLPVERRDGPSDDAYGPEEDIKGKEHDPIFKVRRCNVVESAPWDRGDAIPTVWYMTDRDWNPNYVGRAEEITLIREHLVAGHITALTEAPDLHTLRRITALVGLGGIGKTQTAIQYAFHYSREYQYIFFLHADDPGKLKQDYAEIAKLLKLSPWERGQEGMVQISIEWLNKNDGWLLIVDNVDKTEEVAPYLPKNSKGHILITSRLQILDDLSPGNLKPIPLELLTPEESSELIIRLTGRTTQGNPTEEAALLELARIMGGLPVALEQAATYIRKLPCTFADYLREFHLRRTKLFASPLSRPSQVEGIIIEDRENAADRDKAIATTWDINFRRIEHEAKKLKGEPQYAAPDLLLVSAFLSPDDIPMSLLSSGARELGPRVAEALQGSGSLRINEALNLLHQFSLIAVNIEAGTYSMHRLVQEVVRKCWMTQDQRLMWAKRVIEVLRRGTRVLSASEGNFPSALKDQHFASFVAKVLMDEWKKEDFEFEEAAELLSQTGYLLTKTDQHEDAKRFLERALEIREKLLGPDHLDVAETLSHFGNNMAEWGHNAEALQYYERALRIRMKHPKQGKDHPDVAQVHNDYGIAYFHLSKYKESREHYLEALRIWRKGGDGTLIASALFGLAMIYQNQTGEEKKAEQHFREAHEKMHNPHMKAHVSRLYGGFLAGLNRDAEAVTLLREGRKLAKQSFGDESRKIIPYNDALKPVLKRLGLMEELNEIERESESIRSR